MQPQAHDILSGRGNGANMHPGNRYFRSLVENERINYATSNPRKKKEIAKKVVDSIYSRSPPGRFLTKVKAKGGEEWELMNQKKILKKVSQALREDQSVIKQSLDTASSEIIEPTSEATNSNINTNIKTTPNDPKNNRQTYQMAELPSLAPPRMVPAEQYQPPEAQLQSNRSPSEQYQASETQLHSNRSPPSDLNLYDMATQFNDSLDLADVMKEGSLRSIRTQDTYNASTEMLQMNSAAMSIASFDVSTSQRANLGLVENDTMDSSPMDFNAGNNTLHNTANAINGEMKHRPGLSFFQPQPKRHTFQSLSGKTLSLKTEDGKLSSRMHDRNPSCDADSVAFDESIATFDFSNTQLETSTRERSQFLNTFKSLSGRTLSLRSIGSESAAENQEIAL